MSNVSVTVTEENNTVTISQPGPAGPQGAGLVTYTDTTDVDVVAGNAVYIKSNGNLAKVIADGSIVPRIAGMVITNTDAGGGAPYKMEGLVDLPNWTALTDQGQTSLSQGSFYYISPTNAGKITASAPTTVGQYVVQIGYAHTASKLNLQIQPPIKL